MNEEMNKKMNEKENAQEQEMLIDDNTLEDVSGGVMLPPQKPRKCPHCGGLVVGLTGKCRKCYKSYDFY